MTFESDLKELITQKGLVRIASEFGGLYAVFNLIQKKDADMLTLLYGALGVEAMRIIIDNVNFSTIMPK